MSNSGFFIEVYRNSRGDCSNRGLSSKHDTIFVECDGIQYHGGPFTEEDAIKSGHPVFVVGFAGGRVHLKPKGETRWTMFGGNFAYCSDSRTPGHPVHIHDRIEG